MAKIKINNSNKKTLQKNRNANIVIQNRPSCIIRIGKVKYVVDDDMMIIDTKLKRENDKA